MKFYKLRHKQTGLFSRGGIDAQFSKKGKTWTSLGNVKLHLAQYKDKHHYGGLHYPGYRDMVELIEYSVGDAEGSVIPF